MYIISGDYIKRELKLSCDSGCPVCGDEHYDGFDLLDKGVNIHEPMDLANALRLVKDSQGTEKKKWASLYRPHKKTINKFLYNEILDKETQDHLKEDWIFFIYYWDKKGIGECLSWDDLSISENINDWIETPEGWKFSSGNETVLIEDHEMIVPEEDEEIDFSYGFQTDDSYLHYFYSDDEWEEIRLDLLQKFEKINAFLHSLNPELAFPVKNK